MAEIPKFEHCMYLIDDEDMEFLPVGMDSYSALETHPRKVLRQIGKYAADTKGTNPADETNALTTRLVSHLFRPQALRD